VYTDYFNSPIGLIEFKASEQGITQVIFCGTQQATVITNELTDRCKQQLKEYFTEKRKVFELPLDAKGTDFQLKVWSCLANIPFGETLSYLDIAKLVSRPKGAQAVGGANGRNPISVILPCHRVLGSNGSLTGYAGGIERKLWLLKHEGITLINDKNHEFLDVENVKYKRQSKTQFLN
jgi:methylated-DNA-[protein]-cysteine S-methyltransferase